MKRIADYTKSTMWTQMVLILTAVPLFCHAAPTGTFRMAIIRVSYPDLASVTYTTEQIADAADELEDFFSELSYGQLELAVEVQEVSVSDTASNYEASRASRNRLSKDAAQLAADAGLDFSALKAVLFLHPVGYQDNVDRTFRQSIGQDVQTELVANLFENEINSAHPPGPSGVWWGAWAHEIGHILILSENENWGHPSGYSSGYDLLDSAYPAHVSAYTLLGPPVVNSPESKRYFSGWLPTSQVVTVTAPASGTSGETIVLAPLSQAPEESTSPQVIKIPLGEDTYYLVEARRRIAADARNRSPGIWDEGVHITKVTESALPPVATIHPCHQAGDCLGDCPGAGTTCGCGDSLDDRLLGDIPGNCWPYSLWHVGDAFLDSDNDIEVRVDAESGNGFAVTVTRGVVPGRPDLLLIPWLTPPMNTWETIDIWVDSICNGYEDEGGRLRFGRRDDGTVVFNGDAPCANHENRIYSKIRNGGDAVAEHIVVRFRLTDPLGVGIRDSDRWLEVGTATEADFPELAALAAGASTDVFATWTPEVTLTEEDYEAGDFDFHSCIQIIIDEVSGELVKSNQDGEGEQENLTVFEVVYDTVTEAYSIAEDEFYLRNIDDRQLPVPPRPFFLHIESNLPEGWKYTVGDGRLEHVLEPGEIRRIPVSIEAPPDARLGQSYMLRVSATTPEIHVRPIPEGHPEPRVEEGLAPVAGVLLVAQTVMRTKISVTGQTTDPRSGVIVAKGRLDPTIADAHVTVDFIDPIGSLSSCQVHTTQNGTFECTLEADQTGLWSVRALWQGNLTHSPAASKLESVEVSGVTLTDSDGDGVPDVNDTCPGTPSRTYVNARGCPLCGNVGMIGVFMLAFAPMAILRHRIRALVRRKPRLDRSLHAR